MSEQREGLRPWPQRRAGVYGAGDEVRTRALSTYALGYGEISQLG